MLLFLLACVKPVPPTQPFLPQVTPAEPKAHPPIVPADGDCPRAVGVAPGFVAECHGVLMPNALMLELRNDEADLAFWEDEARACWRYRALDISACNSQVDRLNQQDAALRAELGRRSLLGHLEFPLGVATGAAAAIIMAFALDEVAR